MIETALTDLWGGFGVALEPLDRDPALADRRAAYRDATAMSLLEAERSDAQYINNALSSTSPPCTAYSTVHSIIRSASGDIERAIYYEIQGIDTYDSSYMTMAVDYANSATTHMQNAHDELQTISYPACPADSSPGGSTGSVGGQGGSDSLWLGACGSVAIAALIVAAIAFAVQNRKNKEAAARRAQFAAPFGVPTYDVPPAPSGFEHLSSAGIPSPAPRAQNDESKVTDVLRDRFLDDVEPQRAPATPEGALEHLTKALVMAKEARAAGRDIGSMRETLVASRRAFVAARYDEAERLADEVIREALRRD